MLQLTASVQVHDPSAFLRKDLQMRSIASGYSATEKGGMDALFVVHAKGLAIVL